MFIICLITVIEFESIEKDDTEKINNIVQLMQSDFYLFWNIMSIKCFSNVWSDLVKRIFDFFTFLKVKNYKFRK